MKKKIKKTKKTKKTEKARKRVLVPDQTLKKIKVRVIGIGGGAGSIVSEIASRLKKADFVAANTDVRALKAIKKAKKFHFGQNETAGLGTGMNVELGEAAAEAAKEKIKKLFEGQDLVVIIACLGGGTSSGATAVFSRISKSLPCLTYGIFTLPFKFEGEKKTEIARDGLEKIRPHLNAFSIIPNERIFQLIDKNTALKEALSAINERLIGNLEGLIEMIYAPGLINIDFADLKTILAGRAKLAYLNAVELGQTNGGEAAKKLISSPLYPYAIKGAKGILYNIVGAKELQLSEVSQISKLISELANKKAKVIFGIGQNQKYKEKIKITLLATGCGLKKEPESKSKPKSRPKPKPKPKPLPPPKPITPKPKPKPKSKPKPRPKPKPKIQPPSRQMELKVRRNALQVKEAVKEEEKEILEKEKLWDEPAILRRKNNEQ